MQTLRHQVDTAAMDQQQSCLLHCAQCNLKLSDVLWQHVSLMVVCSMCLQITRFCKWFGSACLNVLPYKTHCIWRHFLHKKEPLYYNSLLLELCSLVYAIQESVQQSIRGDNVSPDSVNTAGNQCVHVVLYTTPFALVVWPLPADHSHWQVHTTLPGLMWRFCSLAPPSSKFWLRSYFITPLLPAPLLQNGP